MNNIVSYTITCWLTHIPPAAPGSPCRSFQTPLCACQRAFDPAFDHVQPSVGCLLKQSRNAAARFNSPVRRVTHTALLLPLLKAVHPWPSCTSGCISYPLPCTHYLAMQTVLEIVACTFVQRFCTFAEPDLQATEMGSTVTQPKSHMNGVLAGTGADLDAFEEVVPVGLHRRLAAPHGQVLLHEGPQVEVVGEA